MAMGGKLLRTLFALALALILLWAAFRGINFKDIWLKLKEGNLFWMGLALACSLLSHIVRALRWKLLLEPSGHHVHWLKAFWATMVGYLTNYAFPRLGEVSRCAMLARTGEVPIQTVLGTVVAERAIDLVCLVLLIIGVGMAYLETVGGVLQTRLFAPLAANPTKLAIAVLVGLLLLGLGLLALRRMQQSQLAFARKAVDFVHGIWGGVLAAGRLKKPFSFVALTVAMWLLYFLGPYFTLFAFPFTSHLGVQAGLFVLLFGSIGFVAPVQGGIGAYHLMVTEGLLLLGIARTDGLAFATVVHGGQMVMVLIFGAIGVLVSRKTPLPFSKVEFETKTGLKTKQ